MQALPEGVGTDSNGTLRRRRSAGDLTVEIANGIKDPRDKEKQPDMLGSEVWSDFSLNETADVSIDKPTSQLLATLLDKNVNSQKVVADDKATVPEGAFLRPTKKANGNGPAPGSRSSSMSPLSVSDSDSDSDGGKKVVKEIAIKQEDLESRFEELLKRERQAQERERQQQEFLRRLEERERKINEKEQELHNLQELSPITKQNSPEAASEFSIAWPEADIDEAQMTDYERSVMELRRRSSEATTEHNVTLPPEPAHSAKSPLASQQAPLEVLPEVHTPEQLHLQPQHGEQPRARQVDKEEVYKQQHVEQLQSQPAEIRQQPQLEQSKGPASGTRGIGRARRINERLAQLEGKLATRMASRNASESVERKGVNTQVHRPQQLSYRSASAALRPKAASASPSSERQPSADRQPFRSGSPSPAASPSHSQSTGAASSNADLYPLFLEFMNTLDEKNLRGQKRSQVKCWPPTKIQEEPRSRESSPRRYMKRAPSGSVPKGRAQGVVRPAVMRVRPVVVEADRERRSVRASSIVTVQSSGSNQRGRPSIPLTQTSRSASNLSHRSRSNSQPSRVPPLTGRKPAWRPSGSSISPSTKYKSSNSTNQPAAKIGSAPVRIGRVKKGATYAA
eukprot:TRINITY_DN19754_c0_g1_i1.p1 TRINITY_DN19754_c0_g1~~TRINITY_DN19754_c0_g1_i1.p1  ORF type:complete len:637 (+),score=115.22 TRINITY_DN19754_c0_g1_i1:42-1913(+)